MIELTALALLLRLMLSEPTAEIVRAHGGDVAPRSASTAIGGGVRIRFPVGSNDALRLRTHSRVFRARETAAGEGIEQSRYGVSLDYLWGGQSWESRWYAGVGAGWLQREDSMTIDEYVTTDAVSASLIVGRSRALWRGQVILEARLDVSLLDGKASPETAISLGYRLNFAHVGP
jgi:hypothetical protein